MKTSFAPHHRTIIISLALVAGLFALPARATPFIDAPGDFLSIEPKGRLDVCSVPAAASRMAFDGNHGRAGKHWRRAGRTPQYRGATVQHRTAKRRAMS
jgi:hypothetical protein